MASLLPAAHRAPALRHAARRVVQQRRWAQVLPHDAAAAVQHAPGAAPVLPMPGVVRFASAAAVLDKYRDKLDRKAREQGLGGVDELREAYRDRIEQVRRRDAKLPPGAEKQVPAAQGLVETAASSPAAAPSATSPSSSTAAATTAGTSPQPGAARGPKPLSSLLDVSKAAALPSAELAAVWRLRHAADPASLCAAVPSRAYAAMVAAARACPQFVLPLPVGAGRMPAEGDAAGEGAAAAAAAAAGEGGAELHFCQWTFDPTTVDEHHAEEAGGRGGGHEKKRPPPTTVLFTRLAEYKLRGEFAVPHTTVTHYTDLAGGPARDGEGLVLMHGQVGDASDGRTAGVGAEDARWLVMCLQRFYGAWDAAGAEGEARAAERRKLLHWFASGDQRFSVEKLLEEAERIG